MTLEVTGLKLTKYCPRCTDTQPVSEFHPKATTRDKLQPLCKTCDRISAREYQARRRAKLRGFYAVQIAPRMATKAEIDALIEERPSFPVPADTPMTCEEVARRRRTARLEKKAYTDEEIVYVVVHPCWPEFCKIGHTCNPEDRLRQYNTGDPLKRYAYAETIPVFDRKLAERHLHEMLDSFRHEKTEWFKISADDAIRMLRSLHSGTYVEV